MNAAALHIDQRILISIFLPHMYQKRPITIKRIPVFVQKVRPPVIFSNDEQREWGKIEGSQRTITRKKREQNESKTQGDYYQRGRSHDIAKSGGRKKKQGHRGPFYLLASSGSLLTDFCDVEPLCQLYISWGAYLNRSCFASIYVTYGRAAVIVIGNQLRC